MNHVLTDLNLASMVPGPEPYGLISGAAIAIRDKRINWAGPAGHLPGDYRNWSQETLGGHLVTPALIDCHTHIVHGGDRAREFELRLKGASYEEIALTGGGIRSTVNATRAASLDELCAQSLPRLDHLIAEGVGTIEIKSGYGLDLETELRLLTAARRLEALRDIRVSTSFLGAHAVPPEFEGRAGDYISFLCEEVLPAAHAGGLVDAVDGFCETIAFSPDQIARLFETAGVLGLPVRLHAEQLSNSGGAVMAAGRGALSVDHLEYLPAGDAAKLAAPDTVAVLLPGAYYALRETQLPPVDALRSAGVPIAIATDCNPGSSPLTSLLLAVNMACTLFRLTPEEAIAGVTRHAAKALGLGAEIGTIEAGKIADLAVWDVRGPAELAYRIGFNPLSRRIIGGQL